MLLNVGSFETWFNPQGKIRFSLTTRCHLTNTPPAPRLKGNYVHDNGDAGIALMEIFNATVSDNIFRNNQFGIRLSVGCADNVFSNNLISDSHK